MQGIAGIVYPDIFQISHLLIPMLDSMGHRGKETRDSYVFKNFQVGICGQKLAANEKKNIIAGLDGNIHNSESLREIFKKHGRNFASLTPAEIVLYAYELWNVSLMEHIQGDFGLFILDLQKEHLLLARDRIGKKPLYWFQDQHHFIFASELKALLATGAVPQTPAADALSTYLFFGYTPQDMTPIKNVNKLLPGHSLVLNRERSISIQTYWSYSSYFEKEVNNSKEAVAQHLDSSLKRVASHTLSNQGAVGCFMTGDLDSASAAYYLRQHCPEKNLGAFSVSFEAQNGQSFQAAKAISEKLNFEFESEKITPQTFLKDLVEIIWHLDEPLADPNIITCWRLSKIASLKTNLMFSGMGCNQLLADHSRYSSDKQHFHPFQRFMQLPLSFLKKMITPILYNIYRPSAYKLLKQARINPEQLEYLAQNALFDQKLMASAAPKISKYFDPEVFLHRFYNLNRIKSSSASFLYLDVKTLLADSWILQFDRLTAANGLEWSAPFLDQSLLEYLASLSKPENIQASQVEILLKTLLDTELSQLITNRAYHAGNPRIDFPASWVENSELNLLFQMLPKGTLVETGLISQQWLKKQVETSQKRENAFKHLWGILILEIWFRLYINRPMQSRPPDISVKNLLMER